MESDRYYYINEVILRNLLESEARLMLLERAGVNYWICNSKDAERYFKESGLNYDSGTFKRIVDANIKRFDEVGKVRVIIKK